jgi:hypothetical protein
MRLRTLIKVLALVFGTGAIIRYQRNQRLAAGRGGPSRDTFAADPSDPVQGFDEISELQAEPLDVDALSREDIAAAQDLAALDLDIDRITAEEDVQIELIDVDALAVTRDSGDLYGVHTPAAVDRTHPDNDQSFNDGQNWIEALETSAVENGAEPERELSEIVDDEDVFRAPHASLARDVPIADLGSGGRRGL